MRSFPSLLMATMLTVFLSEPLFAQSSSGGAGSTGGAAGASGAAAGGATGTLGSGAPNPGLNAHTSSGRVGPGGAPLAIGPSGSSLPGQGSGPAGAPQAIGPPRDATGNSVGVGRTGANGSAATSSERAGCASEGQTATASGTIYQRDTTGLGPTPRIMAEEPGRPSSAASAGTGRGGAGC